ncbi:hypothetical protein C0J52_09932 [Blattella germanica]|nr:hypothetical protein C0J52_09932 [Blattella germanica]
MYVVYINSNGLMLINDAGGKNFINYNNKTGKTPLHEASQISCPELIDYLISHGAEPDALTRSSWTPLMLAASKNGIRAFKSVMCLIHYKANPNMQNKDGWTVLHIACRAGDDEIVKFLLDRFPFLVLRTSRNGRYPIHTAGTIQPESNSSNGLTEESQSQNSQVPKPRYIACRDGESDNSLSLLIKLSIADREMLSKNGDPVTRQSAWDTNALHGHLHIVKMLLKVDPGLHSVLDSCGTLPVHDASRSNNCEIVDLLVNECSCINQCDSMGLNCLHMAAQAGATAMIKFLLRKWKMDVNIVNVINKFTALDYAVQAGQTDAIRQLLIHGADPQRKDSELCTL